MKKRKETPLDEFKFHYEIGNSVGTSDKYFLAHDLDEASEMFEYARALKESWIAHRDPSGKMEPLEIDLGKIGYASRRIDEKLVFSRRDLFMQVTKFLHWDEAPRCVCMPTAFCLWSHIHRRKQPCPSPFQFGR